jgi:hypothetical protein
LLVVAVVVMELLEEVEQVVLEHRVYKFVEQHHIQLQLVEVELGEFLPFQLVQLLLQEREDKVHLQFFQQFQVQVEEGVETEILQVMVNQEDQEEEGQVMKPHLNQVEQVTLRQ